MTSTSLPLPAARPAQPVRRKTSRIVAGLRYSILNFAIGLGIFYAWYLFFFLINTIIINHQVSGNSPVTYDIFLSSTIFAIVWTIIVSNTSGFKLMLQNGGTRLDILGLQVLLNAITAASLSLIGGVGLATHLSVGKVHVGLSGAEAYVRGSLNGTGQGNVGTRFALFFTVVFTAACLSFLVSVFVIRVNNLVRISVFMVLMLGGTLLGTVQLPPAVSDFLRSAAGLDGTSLHPWSLIASLLVCSAVFIAGTWLFLRRREVGKVNAQ